LQYVIEYYFFVILVAFFLILFYFCYLETFYIMKLRDLKPNQKAIVVNCQEMALPLKLMEMGCVDGVEIKLLNKAPLGTPMYFLMGDTRIALGREIVDEIDVQLIDEENAEKKA